MHAAMHPAGEAPGRVVRTVTTSPPVSGHNVHTRVGTARPIDGWWIRIRNTRPAARSYTHTQEVKPADALNPKSGPYPESIGSSTPKLRAFAVDDGQLVCWWLDANFAILSQHLFLCYIHLKNSNNFCTFLFV